MEWWKLALSTFVLIFFAELGDKTQLATLAFAAQSRLFLPVFIGAAAALVATTAIATLVGTVMARTLPTVPIKVVSGILFIGFGIFTLYQALKPQG